MHLTGFHSSLMDHLRSWVLALFSWIEKTLWWWRWWWRRKVTATLMWWLSNRMRIKCLHRRAKYEDEEKKYHRLQKGVSIFFLLVFCACLCKTFCYSISFFVVVEWMHACVSVQWMCWFFLVLTNAFTFFFFHSIFCHCFASSWTHVSCALHSIRFNVLFSSFFELSDSSFCNDTGQKKCNEYDKTKPKQHTKRQNIGNSKYRWVCWEREKAIGVV